MLLKRTVAEVSSEFERHADKISGELRETGDEVATALVLVAAVVGTVAVMALVIALAGATSGGPA